MSSSVSLGSIPQNVALNIVPRQSNWQEHIWSIREKLLSYTIDRNKQALAEETGTVIVSPLI